jgi:DNA-binding XRE family transcriptional regulator
MAEQSQANGNRVTHKIRDLKRLRMRIKPRMSQAKLAREAGVSVDTYRKAERDGAVTEVIANAIFDAVNELLGKTLDRSKYIQEV